MKQAQYKYFRINVYKRCNTVICSANYIHIRNHVYFRFRILQNPFLTAQSTQIKSVISVPIKYFIHHYPRALFNDIPRVGAHFYDIPGSGHTFTTYPGRSAVLTTYPGHMFISIMVHNKFDRHIIYIMCVLDGV